MTPGAVTLHREGLAELRAVVEGELEEAGLASCQYALGLEGEIVASETLGDAPAHARYCIFSATKILVPAVIWQLIGEGQLDPSLPVATWWPGFGQGGKDGVTLAQVLSHGGGFPMATLSHNATFDRDLRIAEIEAWTLEWEPGTRMAYHPLSAHWVLAELVARVLGIDHRLAVRERLLDPLGLDRLELGTPVGRQGDVQPLRPCGAPSTPEEVADAVGPELARLLSPILTGTADAGGPDDPAHALLSPEGLAAGVPGGGAVADAANLALLYQALLHDPKGLWEPSVLQDATHTIVNRHPFYPGVLAMRGLGVEISGDDAGRVRRIGSGATSPAAFGHGGAFGQIAWADPESGLSFAFLTNGADRNAARALQRDVKVNTAAAACIA